MKSLEELKTQIKLERKEKGYVTITREMDRHPELFNFKPGDTIRVGNIDVRIIK